MKIIFFLILGILSRLHATHDTTNMLPDFSYHKKITPLLQRHINEQAQDQLSNGKTTIEEINTFRQEQQNHYLPHIKKKKIDLSFLTFDSKTSKQSERHIKAFLNILTQADHITVQQTQELAKKAETRLLEAKNKLRESKKETLKKKRESKKIKIQNLKNENPEEYQKRLVRKSEYNKKWLQKNKESNKIKIQNLKNENPEEYQKRLVRKREYQRQHYENLKKNPEKYQKRLAQLRESRRQWYQNKKAANARSNIQSGHEEACNDAQARLQNLRDSINSQTPGTPFLDDVAEILANLDNGRQTIRNLSYADPGTPGHRLFESLYSDDETEVEDEPLTFAKFPNDLGSDEDDGDDLFSLDRRKTLYHDDDTDEESQPKKIQKTD